MLEPSRYAPASDAGVAAWTDVYFKRSRQIVEAFGDVKVTYAFFVRRPVISAPQLMLDWLGHMAAVRGANFEIEVIYPEGKWVGAGEPIVYISGQMSQLCDLETLLLQKLGPACVAAFNAYTMCAALPDVAFLAMDARHCAGTEMAEMMAYAAAVGSARAKRKAEKKDGVIGFIGNATDATAVYFGNEGGMGTMPHALIGYAGSTLRAAQMYRETFPEGPMTVLVDYFAHEITDSLVVCDHFSDLAKVGDLAIRLDVPGSRYVEGLDPQVSYAVLERNAPDAVRGYRTDEELRYLVGPGVSAAGIWYLREKLDAAGYSKVKIVASSGFNPKKCRLMAEARSPVDVIGTGSFIPDIWPETYATADIVAYDGQPRVKVGREFLLRKAKPAG